LRAGGLGALADFLRPRTPIAEARLGDTVKIVGVLRPTAPLFTAPLSGATCLWYQAAVQVYRPHRYGPETLVDRRAQDVFLDDDTGSAVVRLEAAAIVRLEEAADWCYEPPRPGDDRILATTENVQRYVKERGIALDYHRTPFYLLRTAVRTLFASNRNEWLMPVPELPRMRAARYREVVLRPGDRVAVVGQAAQRPDPTAYPAHGRDPALRLVLGEAPGEVSVSAVPDSWA
jgi:hypothetical protein